MSTPERKVKVLEPEARNVFQDIVGNVDKGSFDGNISGRKEPLTYIAYSTSDEEGNDRGGNVLTTTREFDFNVVPNKLASVAATVVATKKALQRLGFTIQRTGMNDRDENQYEVCADKVVMIEELRYELETLLRVFNRKK